MDDPISSILRYPNEDSFLSGANVEGLYSVGLVCVGLLVGSVFGAIEEPVTKKTESSLVFRHFLSGTLHLQIHHHRENLFATFNSDWSLNPTDSLANIALLNASTDTKNGSILAKEEYKPFHLNAFF